jgi:uncharacterized repeat protein (TIGR01451 family)
MPLLIAQCKENLVGRRVRPLLQALFVAVLAISVVAPAAVQGASAPFMTMTFNPSSIAIGTTSSLEFTIFNNEDNGALSGIGFTDHLPSGLTAVNGSTNACGGTLTTSGGNTITLSGGALADGYICQFAESVTGTMAGEFLNSTGLINSIEGGYGNDASATLTVVAAPAPPTIVMTFSAPTIAQGTSSSLTFTVSNPNPDVTLTDIAFSDSLPGGLVVAYPNGLTGSCGGGFISANASSSHVALSAASLAALSDCTFSVDIVGAADGTWHNVTDPITSANGGTGLTASADLKVVTSATIGMTFNPPSISPNGTSVLTIGLLNPETNNSDYLDLSFTDTLPAGLTVADGSTNVCEFQEDPADWPVLTTSGGNTISVSGVDLYVGWICSFSVTVTGPGVPGDYVNTAGPVTIPDGLPSNIASATLNVLAPPTLAMAFAAPTITIGTHALLTFTVTNPSPNGANLLGVALSASIPAGLSVANGSQNACGGTVTTSGGNTVSLAGAMVGVGSTCTLSVDVTGLTLGAYTTAGGPVSATNAGTGNATTAGVTVVAVPPTPTPSSTPDPRSSGSPGTTLPPTSTGGNGTPGGSGTPLTLLLALASVGGFLAVRRASIRGHYPSSK